MYEHNMRAVIFRRTLFYAYRSLLVRYKNDLSSSFFFLLPLSLFTMYDARTIFNEKRYDIVVLHFLFPN